MELKQSNTKLVRAIRDSVRRAAQSVPKFSRTGNGAIRILFYPCCREADDWLGGLSTFSTASLFDGDIIGSTDITDYEFTFAITPGGSRVIEGEWDGEKRTVDCYAFSAMKIAHCSHAQDARVGLLSGLDLDKKLTEEYGYGPYRGALCVEVKRNSINWCGIYVCVSGADSDDDLKCAFVAIPEIKDFFEKEGNDFDIIAPENPTS